MAERAGAEPGAQGGGAPASRAPVPASWPQAPSSGSDSGRDGGGRIGRLASFRSLRALHPRHVLHRPVRARTGWAGAGPGSQERRERGQRRGRSPRLHLEPRVKVESGREGRGTRARLVTLPEGEGQGAEGRAGGLQLSRKDDRHRGFRRPSSLVLPFHLSLLPSGPRYSSDLKHMRMTRSVDSVQFLPFLTTDVK